METPTAMCGKVTLSFKSHLQSPKITFWIHSASSGLQFSQDIKRSIQKGPLPTRRQARCWKVQTTAVHCLRLQFHCSLSLLSYQLLLEHHLSAWHLFPGQITWCSSMLEKQKSI